MVDGYHLACILAGRTSYLSTSDSRLFIALGAANRADRIEIRWPSGASQEWIDVEADRFPEARKGSATLRPRVGRNGLICPQQSSVRQGSTCYEKLRFSPLAATQSLNILSRPETLNASGSGRAYRMAISRNASSLPDFPESAQAVRYGVPGTPGTMRHRRLEAPYPAQTINGLIAISRSLH